MLASDIFLGIASLMYSPISVSGKCLCHSFGPHCKLHILLNENIRRSTTYYQKKSLKCSWKENNTIRIVMLTSVFVILPEKI